MRPNKALQLDNLVEKDQFLLEKWANKYGVQGVQKSHERRYAVQEPMSYASATDPYTVYHKPLIEHGDVVNITIPLPDLMRLVDESRTREYTERVDMSSHRGTSTKQFDRDMEYYRSRAVYESREEQEYDSYLRQKHTCLRNVWEKYQFTKQMVTDPSRKPK